MIALLTLLCSLLLKGSTSLQVNIKEKFHVDALDCRKPTRVITGLVNTICGNTSVNIDYGTTPITGTLLQEVDSHMVKAIRCERWMTTVYEVCGAFSHTKLYSPISVLEPYPFSKKDCLSAARKLLYNKEDGATTAVNLNQAFTYQFLRHGKITRSEKNIQCIGATININGELHSSMMELNTVRVLIKEVELEIKDKVAVDLDKNEQLPRECALPNQRSCTDGAVAYELINNTNRCPYRIVRKLNTAVVYGRRKQTYVNHEHKILIERHGETVTDLRCKGMGLHHMWDTQYEQLKFMKGEVPAQPALEIRAEEVNPTLEVQVTADYLAWLTDSKTKSGLQRVGATLCKMNQHALQRAERSPFHEGALLRIRGDIVQELTCTPVVAEIRLTEKRTEQCTRDAIPVYVNERPSYLLAYDKIIVDETEISMVPCERSYTPVVYTKEGALITANPVVTRVQLTLTHIGEDYLHLDSNQAHPIIGEDLMYTQTEIQAFNDLVHFSRIKSHVIDSMVERYCGQGSCGDYQPEEQLNGGFSITNLEDQVEEEVFWWKAWLKTLERCGAYSSLICILYFLGTLLYRIVYFLRLAVGEKMQFQRAARLTFFVNSRLRESIYKDAQAAHNGEQAEQAELQPLPADQPS